MKKGFSFVEYFDGPTVKGRTFAQFRGLLKELGIGEHDFSCIHVAGSNGKGSTCAYLESILLRAGCSVGLFTSPALGSAHERFRLNGEEIGDEKLGEVAQRVAAAEEALGKPMGGFDRMYACALAYFAQGAPDWIIVETGIGGNRDITNAMPAEISVITSLGLDHTQLLGNNLAAIAREKAGIIHSGQRCAIVQPQAQEALAVLRRQCQEKNVPLRRVDGSMLRNSPSPYGQRVRYTLPGSVTLNLETRMLGSFQMYNLAAAVLVARELEIDGIAIAEGMREAFLPGRLEYLDGAVPVLLDGAHNPDGMRELMDAMGQFYPGETPLAIFGAGEQKDAAAMLDMMKDRVELIICVPAGGRQDCSPDKLARLARERGIPAQSNASLEMAFAEALSFCESMEEKFPLILVCGSLYLAGNMRDYLLNEQDYQEREWAAGEESPGKQMQR